MKNVYRGKKKVRSPGKIGGISREKKRKGGKKPERKSLRGALTGSVGKSGT